MKNVILMDFKNEPEAYESYAKIKDTQLGDSYVYEAALLKEDEGKVDILESYNLEQNLGSDTITGGLIGVLLGLFTGPFGWLFWGVVGLLVGALFDNHTDNKNASLIEDISKKIKDSNLNLLVVADEDNLNIIDDIVSDYDVVVMRYDYDKIKEEISQAKKMNKEIAKEAHKKAKEVKESSQSDTEEK